MAENKDKIDNEVNLRRRILGFFLFPVALFPLLALLTYDWREIPTLCIPPLRPTSNLIGIAGDWFAYAGYQIFGLAVWVLPFMCILIGLLLIRGRSFNPGRRTAGLALFTLALTCLTQLTGGVSSVQNTLHTLNIEPNAGGAIGYLIMTLGLTRVLSPFGSGVLMASIMLFALLWTIGFRSIIRGISGVLDWCMDRHELTPEEIAEKKRLAEEKEAALNAAKIARAAAKAEQQAEKERIAAERQAEKERIAAEKQAEKERIAAERQAERDRLAAEKQAALQAIEDAKQERLRLAAEKAREAAEAASRAAAMPQPAYTPPPAPQPMAAAPQKTMPPAPPAAAPTEQAAIQPVEEDKGPYLLPPLTLLNPPVASSAEHGDVELMAQKLISTLDQFGVPTTLAFTTPGPVVTQYGLSLAPGVKPEKVTALSATLQMTLEAKSLRIQAPIPGKNAVGIEVPNLKPCGVHFGDIARSETWQTAINKMNVPLLLGKDAAGNNLVSDLASLPHLLIAGATGQGKSVCLNSIINGFLMCRTPEDLRLIMVDPKRVEFTQYNSLPHLLVPIVNDTNKVVYALKWALVEMDRRLKLFSKVGCRNIVDFNTRRKTVQPDLFGGETKTSEKNDVPQKIPYIVVIIDEVADIIQTARKDVEPAIARLTALARATGIHLILATQRPDAKIITGVIKSNIPGRIAFKTSSSIDARTILDDIGA
ncbi:MAG: DNA translocase FtsK 4TM domain-containing protein, partial [Kiritimatiellae bacterium]|nr:DNA translocase FtsK 4TM domain-containing protein [Kiritimatiellia bacterium]